MSWYKQTKTINNNFLKTHHKGIEIDYKEGAACIMQPIFKGFASDEVENGKSGLEKAKEYIDSMEIKKCSKT